MMILLRGQAFFFWECVRARACEGVEGGVYGIKPVRCAAIRTSGELIPSGT